ncbi:hypothetical protein QTH90_06255 [Variovorax sp. J2P1-59]|uniref:hypothetical protein n=1 Tax=Variovorax flavidus TaxID=3053501 RepID=UPI002577F27A|nr:hypothetical protein [Variovorax sp. J2P1-59]MDM0073976.1 hypothetical protein [Variovorax sp. J2P1-59]
MSVPRRGARMPRYKPTPLQAELLAEAVARNGMHTVVQKKPRVRGVRARQEQLVRDIFSGAVPFPLISADESGDEAI